MLFKKIKKYCKYCKYYIKYIGQFDGYKISEDRNPDNGKDICGNSLMYYTDEVGQTKLKAYGEVQRCEECGMITHDARVIRYAKCLEKNRDFKCKEFKPKAIFKLLFIGVNNGN